jgi:hypothetical protein
MMDVVGLLKVELVRQAQKGMQTFGPPIVSTVQFKKGCGPSRRVKMY